MMNLNFQRKEACAAILAPTTIQSFRVSSIFQRSNVVTGTINDLGKIDDWGIIEGFVQLRMRRGS